MTIRKYYSVSFEKFPVCGARYKTRPGLTYHYGHSHRDGASDENSRESVPSSGVAAAGGVAAGIPLAGQSLAAGGMGGGGILGGLSAPVASTSVQPAAGAGPSVQLSTPGGIAPELAPSPTSQPAASLAGQIPPVYQDSYVTFLNHPAGTAFIFLLYFSVFVVCLHVNELKFILFIESRAL